jgi:hypothetical protein
MPAGGSTAARAIRRFRAHWRGWAREHRPGRSPAHLRPRAGVVHRPPARAARLQGRAREQPLRYPREASPTGGPPPAPTPPAAAARRQRLARRRPLLVRRRQRREGHPPRRQGARRGRPRRPRHRRRRRRRSPSTPSRARSSTRSPPGPGDRPRHHRRPGQLQPARRVHPRRLRDRRPRDRPASRIAERIVRVEPEAIGSLKNQHVTVPLDPRLKAAEPPPLATLDARRTLACTAQPPTPARPGLPPAPHARDQAGSASRPSRPAPAHAPAEAGLPTTRENAALRATVAEQARTIEARPHHRGPGPHHPRRIELEDRVATLEATMSASRTRCGPRPQA